MHRWMKALVAAILSIAVLQAHGQGGRAISIVVPYSAGGSSDSVARAIALSLGARLKRPVVVDNRPGANGQIGLEAVAKAPPDGDTLFFGVASIVAMNPWLYPGSRDGSVELVPVIETTSGPFILAAGASAPFSTLEQFIVHAKAHPGQLTYGSPGNGSHAHVGMELLKQAAGIDVRHIPYKGGAPALQGLLGGQVSLVLDTAIGIAPHVRAGKLKALGATGTTRSTALPEVPLVADVLKGVHIEGWHGIFAPRGTSRETVDRLNAEIKAVLADPELGRRFVEAGFVVVANSPAEFAAVIEADRQRYGKAIASAGIRAE